MVDRSLVSCAGDCQKKKKKRHDFDKRWRGDRVSERFWGMSSAHCTIDANFSETATSIPKSRMSISCIRRHVQDFTACSTNFWGMHYTLPCTIYEAHLSKIARARCIALKQMLKKMPSICAWRIFHIKHSMCCVLRKKKLLHSGTLPACLSACAANVNACISFLPSLLQKSMHGLKDWWIDKGNRRRYELCRSIDRLWVCPWEKIALLCACLGMQWHVESSVYSYRDPARHYKQDVGPIWTTNSYLLLWAASKIWLFSIHCLATAQSERASQSQSIVWAVVNCNKTPKRVVCDFIALFLSIISTRQAIVIDPAGMKSMGWLVVDRTTNPRQAIHSSILWPLSPSISPVNFLFPYAYIISYSLSGQSPGRWKSLASEKQSN